MWSSTYSEPTYSQNPNHNITIRNGIHSFFSGLLYSVCSSETIELINSILEILAEKIQPERITREHVKPH